MSVTVDFLFKASKDGTFNNVIKQVTGGIGKLTDEAEKASKHVEDLMSGKFKNAALTHDMLPNLAEAINTGDIEKINEALLETDRILTTLESKLNKQALRHLEDLTVKQTREIANSALKEGAKKSTISKMVLDRVQKNIGKDVSFDVDSVMDDDVNKLMKRAEKLVAKQPLSKEWTGKNLDELKEYIGLYQRLIDLGAKVPTEMANDIKYLAEDYKNGVITNDNGKALFNYKDLMEQVKEASEAQKASSISTKEKKKEKEASEQSAESSNKKAEAEEKAANASEKSAQASEKEKTAKEESANATEKQAEKQEEIASKTEESAQNAENEKEAKKETSEETKKQAEEQQRVTEEEEKSTEATEKEKEAKNETVEKTKEQSAEQQKVAEETKQSAENTKEESSAKEESLNATKEQAKEQSQVTEKEKESVGIAKEEESAKRNTTEATREQASEQEKASKASEESAKNAVAEAQAQEKAASAAREKAEAEIEAAKASDNQEVLSDKQKSKLKKNIKIAEGAIESTTETISKIEAALTGENLVTPKNKQDAIVELLSRRRKIIDIDENGKRIGYLAHKKEIDEKYPEYGYRKYYSYYKQLQMARALGVTDEELGKEYVPEFEKAGKQSESILRSMLEKKLSELKFHEDKINEFLAKLGEEPYEGIADVVKEEIDAIDKILAESHEKETSTTKEAIKSEKELGKAIEENTRKKEEYIKAEEKENDVSDKKPKQEQKAGDMLARIKKKKEEEKKALEQQKIEEEKQRKEEEKERKAEERAEKKIEEKIKLDEGRAKEKQDARQKALDNYAKLTGIKTGSQAKAIEENSQLAEKQKEVAESAMQVEQAENDAANAISNTANVENNAIASLEEKIKLEKSGYRNQVDWLNYIGRILDDKTYDSGGSKKAASDQLREFRKRWYEYNNDPSKYKSEHVGEYPRERIGIGYVKSYLEAKKVGVAESTLNKNFIPELNNPNVVSGLYKILETELEERQKYAEEHVKAIEQAEKELQTIIDKSTAKNKKPIDVSAVQARAEQIADEINVAEQVSTSFEDLLNNLGRKKGQGYENIKARSALASAQSAEDWINDYYYTAQPDQFSVKKLSQNFMRASGDRVLNQANKEGMQTFAIAQKEAQEAAIEFANQQFTEAVDYYIDRTEAIGVTQARSTVVDGDKAVEDAMHEANAKSMKAAQEAQIKAIENGYKKFTSSKQTTYLSNMAKSVRTEQQNRQVAEHENQWNQLEEQYNIAKEAFKDDADALKRINAARDEAIRIGEEALKAVNETAQQKAEQAAQKAEEQAQKAEESAEKQRQRAYNRSTKTIAKKEIREAQKYVDTAQGYIDEGKILDTDKGAEFVRQIEAIKEAINSIGNIDVFSNDDTEQIEMAAEKAHQLADALEKAKVAGKDVIDVSGTEKALDMQQKIGQLMQNNNLSNEQFLKLSNYQEMLEKGGINAKQLDDIAKGYSDINSEVSKGSTLIDAIQGKFKNLVGYMASFMSFYMMIRKAKEVVNTVREFDDALTEMRKVSDESVETLKAYQKESYDMAASVGTDALSLQKSTADYMRLGESLDEAKESAKAANILLNVSEFKSIDEATESLIAMSAAYKDLDKMTIIDKLNKIGNDFAISTDGIATALKDSAAALTTAGKELPDNIAIC